MMMEALEAGGMDAVYSAERDARMNKQWGDPDYVPNKSYYELEKENYRDPEFPAQYDERLVKCLFGGMLLLNPRFQYRVIFMWRALPAIRRSLTAAFGGASGGAEQYDSVDFQHRLRRIVDILVDRRSVLSVTEINYDRVLADPLRVFAALHGIGWPIDAEKAAAIPDSRLNRYGTHAGTD